MRRASQVALGLIAYWVVKALLLALFVPPWTVFDEPFVVERIHAGRRDAVQGDRLWALARVDREIDQSLRGLAGRRALPPGWPGGGLAALVHSRGLWRRRAQYLTGLDVYSQIMASVLRPLGTPVEQVLFRGRLAGVLVGALVLVLIYLAAVEFFPARSIGPLVALAVAAFTPLLQAAVVTVHPRVLAILVFTLLFAGIIGRLSRFTYRLLRPTMVLLVLGALALGPVGLVALPIWIMPRVAGRKERSRGGRGERFWRFTLLFWALSACWVLLFGGAPLVARAWTRALLGLESASTYAGYLPGMALPLRPRLVRGLELAVLPYSWGLVAPPRFIAGLWAAGALAVLISGLRRNRDPLIGTVYALEYVRMQRALRFGLYLVLAAGLVAAWRAELWDARQLAVAILPFSLVAADALVGIRCEPSRAALAWLVATALLLADSYMLFAHLFPWVVFR